MNVVANKPRRSYRVKSFDTQVARKPLKTWAKRDEGAEAFYVYILRLDNGAYYVGHTRELRERMLEHQAGTTASTAGKHPRLQYFEVLPTREAAMAREAEIENIKRKNKREILRMITRFHDLTRELDFE